MDIKKIVVWAMLVALIVLLVGGHGFSVSVAAPGGAAADITPPSGAIDVWGFLASLAGAVPVVISVGAVGGIIAGLVDLFKLTGLFKDQLDGNMGKIATVVNLAVFAIVTVANLFGYGSQVAGFFEKYGPALPTIVAVFSMLGGANLTHYVLKRLQPTSFSYSAQTPG